MAVLADVLRVVVADFLDADFFLTGIVSSALITVFNAGKYVVSLFDVQNKAITFPICDPIKTIAKINAIKIISECSILSPLYKKR